jgi:hypothetical protein
LQYTKLLRSKRLIFPPDDLPHPLVDSAALHVLQLSFSLQITPDFSDSLNCSLHLPSAFCGSSCNPASTACASSSSPCPCHSLLLLASDTSRQSLASTSTAFRMRQAIEKSEMLQVACDSYPLWMLKRPSRDSYQFRCDRQSSADFNDGLSPSPFTDTCHPNCFYLPALPLRCAAFGRWPFFALCEALFFVRLHAAFLLA